MKSKRKKKKEKKTQESSPAKIFSAEIKLSASSDPTRSTYIYEN